MDIGREGAPNSDGVASAGFDCSTAGTVRNEEGGVAVVAALVRMEELVKKFGIPFGAALDIGVTAAGSAGASGATFTASGVGGMSAILGGAGAGVVRAGIGATLTVSAVGGTDVGLVRENGSEIIGGSFAWVKSWVIVIYEL